MCTSGVRPRPHAPARGRPSVPSTVPLKVEPGSSVTSSFNDSAAVAGSIREMALADSAPAVGLGSDHLIEARVIRQPVAGNGDPGQRLPRSRSRTTPAIGFVGAAAAGTRPRSTW